MADTWRDLGMTPDDQWQKIHKVQIVGCDREGRRVAMRTLIVNIAHVRTCLSEMQTW